jgi:hypothetical protein
LAKNENTTTESELLRSWTHSVNLSIFWKHWQAPVVVIRPCPWSMEGFDLESRQSEESFLKQPWSEWSWPPIPNNTTLAVHSRLEDLGGKWDWFANREASRLGVEGCFETRLLRIDYVVFVEDKQNHTISEYAQRDNLFVRLSRDSNSAAIALHSKSCSGAWAWQSK